MKNVKLLGYRLQMFLIRYKLYKIDKKLFRIAMSIRKDSFFYDKYTKDELSKMLEQYDKCYIGIRKTLENTINGTFNIKD